MWYTLYKTRMINKIFNLTLGVLTLLITVLALPLRINDVLKMPTTINYVHLFGTLCSFIVVNRLLRNRINWGVILEELIG